MYALQERYGADAFPDDCRVFEWLDVDGDGRLTRRDVANDSATAEGSSAGRPSNSGFAESRAPLLPWDVRITLQLGPSTERWIESVEFARSGDNASRQVARSPNRIVWNTSQSSVTLFALDRPQAAPLAAVERQLDALDGDGNGYLELDELPEPSELRAEFAGLDRDGDGKLYPEEWAAGRRRQAEAADRQVRARAGFQPDALFVALDMNHDGRLTPREIDRAAERLASLDEDGDGQLQVDEIPDAMVVGIVRGPPEEDSERLRNPTAPPLASDIELPRWFIGMDRNMDGEISEREFMGTPAQFQLLDANGDQFLDAAEATMQSGAERQADGE